VPALVVPPAAKFKLNVVVVELTDHDLGLRIEDVVSTDICDGELARCERDRLD
jgi:hypothetical protein